MEKTTEEAMSEKAQHKLNRTRTCNRDYYHARKQASICEHCKKTYSSVSALRRHQLRNIKCQLLHERDTREKFQKMLQERLTTPDQEEELSLKIAERLAVCVRNKQTTPGIKGSYQADIRHNDGGGNATLLAALRCSHIFMISSICHATSSGSGDRSNKTPLLLTV